MNMRKLLKQAEQMKEKLQSELSEMIVEVSVGDGMVTVKMNGHKTLIGVTIDPEVMDPEDPGLLQDLIVAGVNQASKRIEETMREKMGSMTSDYPGFF